MPDREPIGRTLLVAGGVAFVCSLIVSAAVTWLRPIQLAYQSIEQNRLVLVAAGLVTDAAALDDREIVARSLELEPRLVDLDAASYVSADASMISAYDYRTAADDPAASRAIDAAADIAALGRRPQWMPVYLRYVDGARERLILPVYGSGMWSTIRAFLVLDGSLTRVVGFYVAEQGETPGLGDRIEDPRWLAQWQGKRVYGDDGAVALRVGGPVNGADDTRVDGITGATVTVNAVDAIVRYWLGDDGYGPYLAALRAGE